MRIDIIGWIKGWRLDKFLKGVAGGDKEAADNLHDTTEKAVELVNNLKAYLQNPMGDFVTAVIPGDWDNDLKAKAELFITKIAGNASLITDCTNLSTAGEQLVCVYSKITGLNDEDEEDSFWHKLGVLATKVFADGKITFGDAVVAAEFIYRVIVKKPVPGI